MYLANVPPTDILHPKSLMIIVPVETTRSMVVFMSQPYFRQHIYFICIYTNYLIRSIKTPGKLSYRLVKAIITKD